ncbi:hypothetical protein BLA29_001411 [Euroglyphus maynei]|uniref:Uncharacterized protein n=1 Tax=Euroglyphus maynei TaxID=6958 RepID=A0A1Y3ARF5_EURMA|nr:hypothetical protein BLA29_001411 [Euroglyphus maynei]
MVCIICNLFRVPCERERFSSVFTTDCGIAFERVKLVDGELDAAADDEAIADAVDDCCGDDESTVDVAVPDADGEHPPLPLPPPPPPVAPVEPSTVVDVDDNEL